MDILSDIKQTFKDGSVLTRLIYINLGVFLLVKLVGVFFILANQPFSLTYWLSLPSGLDELIRRPYTLITYMFLHEGFIHILFNLLGLYWFGKLFLYYFEGDKLLSVYLFGGIAGGVLYMISYSIFPVFASVNGLLLGASASVIAILVAVAVYEPNREIGLMFIGNVALKYVAGFYVLLSILSISSSNPGGNIAHIGGAVWGWFYIYQLRRGNDIGRGLIKFLNKIPDMFSRKSKMKVTYKQPPRDDYEYNRQKNVQQEEINRILDKIAKSGYESLNKEEKELLFKQGKK
ncbi:rhomboid family protein [Maribellus maritimus]|uniref:rhomboid family protein n=1 Tax=Maribellus maritimus TaxID=2870838 RepID=UPI001EEC5666|nr:rhomboid family intramembrane serine protease [Maribellus maritimus]MCG6191200.1 rhomboid family intramembrane serine protease [Maribellus maritimus]